MARGGGGTFWPTPGDSETPEQLLWPQAARHQRLESRERLCCSELACFGGLSGPRRQQSTGSRGHGDPPGLCQVCAGGPGHSVWDGRGLGVASVRAAGLTSAARGGGAAFPLLCVCGSGRDGPSFQGPLTPFTEGPVFVVSRGPGVGLSGRLVFVSTAVGTGLPCVTLEPEKSYRTAAAQSRVLRRTEREGDLGSLLAQPRECR